MTEYPSDFIPSRHRRSVHVADVLGRLTRLMPALQAPDETRWRAIGLGLMEGDPPMDALLSAMIGHGLREARAQFEQALQQGIDAVPDALPALRRFFAAIATPPAWLDRDRLARGAAAFRRCGATALDVGRDVALMGGYQASAFNRTLILTGALQKGPTRRLAETLQWTLDCTAEGGLDAQAPGWRSTLRVRFIHALVRRSVAARGDWQMADWGLPINQIDMAATLYGSITVPVLGSRCLGILLSRRERDDVAHLARYLGRLIGVDERWLTDTEAAGAAQLLELLLSLANPDETSIMMARPLADEPLSRPYRAFARWRGRLARSRHLSISRAFLGADGLQRLGLPTDVLPWYPALLLPVNLVRSGSSRVLPGGLHRATRHGRTAQEVRIRELTARHPAVVGESVLAPV